MTAALFLLPLLQEACEERTIATLPTEYIYHTVFGAGETYAVTTVQNSKYVIVHNGKSYKPILEIVDFPVLSANGKGVACVSREGPGKLAVVFGDKKGEVFDEIKHLDVSPDGSKIAYAAKLPGKYIWVVVTGDKKGKEFFSTRTPVFGEDSKTLAYVGRDLKTMKDVAFIGDRKLGEYDHAFFQTPCRGPFWAVGMRGTDWYLITAKGEHGPYPGMRWPVVSSDGNHWAGGIRREGRGLVVVDGKERDLGGREFYGGTFSPDGSRLACRLSRGGDRYFQLDTEDPIPVSELRFPVWNSDGTRVAVAVYSSPSKWYILCGDRKSEKYDEVSDPVFHPDGSCLAFSARKGKELLRRVLSLK